MAYRTILTALGRALEVAATASGGSINLTHMAVGDGNGNPVTPAMLESMTFLGRERFRAPVNRIEVDPQNPARFVAELVIPASEGGFVLREAGLFTADGVMFAVGNLPETYKPTANEGAFSDTVVSMVFEVTNTSIITLVLDPNIAVATRAWVQNNVSLAAMVPGGLTAQVLAKKSNANGDVHWVDPTSAVEVIIHSREETQTLAAEQTVVDLAILTSEGTAAYVNGVRLRRAEFDVTGPTQITLGQSYPTGTRLTVVQNEEVGGATDFLRRDQNLADLPDKAVARANLGLAQWLPTVGITWSQLTGVPAYATRWPSWSEITNKPDFGGVTPHTHVWDDILNTPATATRWPTWGEVTSKPSLFPPASHSHAIADVTGLQAALDGKAPSSHTHPISNVIGLQAALDGKAPSSHTHPISNVTGLQDALDGKAPTSHAHQITDVTGLQAALNNKVNLSAGSDGFIRLQGSTAACWILDRTSNREWAWYATGDKFHLWNGSSDIVSISPDGTLGASKFARNSSRRYKFNIKTLTPDAALRMLAGVRLTSYRLKRDNSKSMGVIAEELADGPLDFAVIRNAEGEPDAVDYQPLFVLACAALQGLASRVSTLEAAAHG